MDFKSILRSKMNLSFVMLWLYLWILFSLQTLANDARMTIIFAVILGVLSFISSFLILKTLSSKFTKVKMEAKNQQSLLIGIFVAMITFLIFEAYLAGQYPGGMSTDTIAQYSQAIGDLPYNDWHPVLHTLFFFTLPLKMGHGLGFVIFMQLLYFSVAFGYLIYTLYKNGCPKLFCGLICFYIWFNPFLATNMMYPWKDIGMLIFAILLMGYYIQIMCTHGEWINRKSNLLLFSAIVVICSFMRHNAILFTAPLVLNVLFYLLKNRKTRVFIALFIMFFFLLVKFTYIELKVEQPNSRIVEIVGLPVTIWCNVMKKTPDVLPENTVETMHELASQNSYEDYYSTGSFNSIKYTGLIDLAKINSLSYWDILKYTYQCFRYAPKASFEAFAKLTDIVWGIDGKVTPKLSEVKEDNPWGIVKKPYLSAELFTRQNIAFFSSGFGKVLFGSIGFEMLCMFALATNLFASNRFSFIHLLPLFCYDFGTMLLLSTDDYRFFLLNLPLWLPVIFLMLHDRKKLVLDKP